VLRTTYFPVGLFLVLALLFPVLAAEDAKPLSPVRAAVRTFQMDYGATVNDLPAGTTVRVWIPVPQTNDHQRIRSLRADLPARAEFNIDPVYGNRILSFETTAPASGSIVFSTAFLVRRREVQSLEGMTSRTRLSAGQKQLYLSANEKVPLSGKPLELLAGIEFSTEPLSVARLLYDRVDQHVRYDKSRPGYGNGDVLWVCDSQFGNCTDFHSLFISWARSRGLPARFEIGFPLPPQRGKGSISGYHCWALFHTVRRGWVPVDISEADKHPEMKEYFFGNMTENRVTFTTGRDIELVPRQAGPPLNYFIYPHVEVDGKPWPRESIKLVFSYSDVK
jgi:hypothetical protein